MRQIKVVGTAVFHPRRVFFFAFVLFVCCFWFCGFVKTNVKKNQGSWDDGVARMHTHTTKNSTKKKNASMEYCMHAYLHTMSHHHTYYVTSSYILRILAHIHTYRRAYTPRFLRRPMLLIWHTSLVENAPQS